MSEATTVQSTAPGSKPSVSPMDGCKVRVVIAERHDDVRQATADLVADFAGFEVVGLARDVDEAVRLVEQLRPDLVFIDAWLKEGGSYEAALRIQRLAPRTTVAALSSVREVELARRLRVHGGLGCYDKEHLAEALPTILESVRRR